MRFMIKNKEKRYNDKKVSAIIRSFKVFRRRRLLINHMIADIFYAAA